MSIKLRIEKMISKLMLFKSPTYKSPSIIKEVHALHKPNLFTGSISGNRWRHKSMGKTLDWITDFNKVMELQTQAQSNLKKWAKKRISSPNLVEVVFKDWGVATLEATKKYGVPYSVLNMANPIFPGGAALEGGSEICGIEVTVRNPYWIKSFI